MSDHKGAIVAVLVAGLLIGGGVGYAAGNGSDSSSEQNKTSNSVAAVESGAAATRVALNNALREHVSLGAATLRAAFDGSPNTEALLGTLDDNSKEVAGLVGSVYGDQAEEQFLSLWRSHIGFFADYTTAAKQGNNQAMQKALEDLAGYSQDASAFFEGANPNLPASAVMPLLKEHRDLVIKAVNEYGAGNREASYAAEQEARDQVGQIADALAFGIVKQSPDKF